MPENKTDATPPKVKPTKDSPMAHSIEMDRLLLKNAKVEAALDAVTKELAIAKAAMKKIEADYKAEVCTKLKMDIQTVLGISDAERDKLCYNKSDEELSAMLDNFVTATNRRTPEEPGTFKPIITGAAEPRKYGDNTENFTVGDLFGKSKKEIKEMGGAF